MRLFIDLDTAQVIEGPTFNKAVSSIFLKRGDNVPIEVSFCQSGAIVELGSGATGKLGIKTVGAYDGDFLASAASWTKTGTGTATKYTFTLNLNTEELDDAFAKDTEPEDDVAQVVANAEVEWVVGTARTSTRPFLATVDNDVIRGDEAVPTATAATSFPMQSSDNSIWTITIGNDGVFSATKS